MQPLTPANLTELNTLRAEAQSLVAECGSLIAQKRQIEQAIERVRQRRDTISGRIAQLTSLPTLPVG